MRYVRPILAFLFGGIACLWLGISNWTKDDPGTHGWFYEHYGQRGNAIALLIVGAVLLSIGLFVLSRAIHQQRAINAGSR